MKPLIYVVELLTLDVSDFGISPTAPILVHRGLPELVPMPTPRKIADCKFVAGCTPGELGAVLHGTDCDLSISIAASMASVERSATLAACQRRAAGGVLELLGLVK